MKGWQLQDAKAHFSALVKKAMADGPQNITVRGKPAVVVISKKEFDKLKKPKISLVELLARSPLKGVELDLEREQSLNREIDL